MSDEEFGASIVDLVREGLAELAPDEHAWASARLVPPRRIEVVLKDGTSETTEEMWLVTH